MPYCIRLDFLLEVIATSVEDAVEAQAGGAGRIELCASLDAGGLTPPLAMVREVVRSVSIPVRVMVCENPSYETPSAEELQGLLASAKELAPTGISGLVIGFARGSAIDINTLRHLAAAAPHLRITFHRVFERLQDPVAAIGALKTVPEVDRILLSNGNWRDCTAAASPEIQLIAGGGLRAEDFRKLLRTTDVREFHTGRAVRRQQKADGCVDAQLVRSLIEQIAAD